MAFQSVIHKIQMHLIKSTWFQHTAVWNDLCCFVFYDLLCGVYTQSSDVSFTRGNVRNQDSSGTEN